MASEITRLKIDPIKNETFLSPFATRFSLSCDSIVNVSLNPEGPVISTLVAPASLFPVKSNWLLTIETEVTETFDPAPWVTLFWPKISNSLDPTKHPAILISDNIIISFEKYWFIWSFVFQMFKI